jgi:hypothetical protein
LTLCADQLCRRANQPLLGTEGHPKPIPVEQDSQSLQVVGIRDALDPWWQANIFRKSPLSISMSTANHPSIGQRHRTCTSPYTPPLSSFILTEFRQQTGSTKMNFQMRGVVQEMVVKGNGQVYRKARNRHQSLLRPGLEILLNPRVRKRKNLLPGENCEIEVLVRRMRNLRLRTKILKTTTKKMSMKKMMAMKKKMAMKRLMLIITLLLRRNSSCRKPERSHFDLRPICYSK